MQTRQAIRERVARITAWTAVGATLAATGLAARAAGADHSTATAANTTTTTSSSATVEQPTTEDDFGITQSEQIPTPAQAPSNSSGSPDAVSGGS